MDASMLTPMKRRLLNDWQRDFPLEPRPYECLATELGMTEDEVISALSDLKERGLLGRIGAVIKPHSVGASTLAAMAVPTERLDEVAALISSYPEVNHNYEREHAFNLWFVATGPDSWAIVDLLAKIEHETGLAVLDLPMEEAFHIDLGFDLT